MGISNYYPNSRASQPGVCTSSTRPALPYEGQMIYETDTDKVLVWTGSNWNNTGAPTGGSSGQVLTKNSSTDYDTSWTGPMGLVLIKSQTIGTTVSSVDVTDVFSSTYDNYLLTLYGGVSSTSQVIGMQLGSSTASYYGALFYVNSYATGATSVLTQNGGANTGMYFGEGNANTNQGYINLYGPNLSKYTSYSGSYVGTVSGFTGGYHGVASAYTGCRVYVSGTMTGGVISVYGYRK